MSVTCNDCYFTFYNYDLNNMCNICAQIFYLQETSRDHNGWMLLVLMCENCNFTKILYILSYELVYNFEQMKQILSLLELIININTKMKFEFIIVLIPNHYLTAFFLIYMSQIILFPTLKSY